MDDISDKQIAVLDDRSDLKDMAERLREMAFLWVDLDAVNERLLNELAIEVEKVSGQLSDDE